MNRREQLVFGVSLGLAGFGPLILALAVIAVVRAL